jgi:hypothetical protein
MDGEEKTQAANHETSLDLFDDIWGERFN